MTPRRDSTRAAGYALLTIYITSIWAANWLTTRYGLIAAFPGTALKCTAGTFAVGGAIMTRDLLQDALGRRAVLCAISAGAVLSYATSSHVIAVASGVTFLLAETIEFAVYTPLRKRYGWGTGRWSGVVGVANATGALADTFLFLWLAGFPLTASVVAGQMAGKAYVTIAVIGAGVVLRRAVLREPVHTAGT
jgi:queuosine precursor transporter